MVSYKKVLNLLNYKTNVVSVPERLDDKKLQQLFGDNYCGVSYYDFDAGRWVPSAIVSAFVNQMTPSVGVVDGMRRNIESMPEFKTRELVGAAVMVINGAKSRPVIAPLIRQPVFGLGKDVVGTIIVRDKKTGRIMQPADWWVGVHRFPSSVDALAHGGREFMEKCGNFNSPYVKILMHFIRAAHQK